MRNSKGKLYYGVHMYPGVAEYKEQGENFRVFLNENTIRAMGPSFSGRPVFVMHVDEVNEDLDELRGEVDGWVIESFYNEADGKHWAKFIVCSEKGERAIRNGYRLSNCYTPTAYGKGGEWNGVSYSKEIKGGEYEHLAIVPNPRYEESVILTPEEFKEYNESKRVELLKLANSKGKKMGLKIFKRAKVENAADLENMVVVLPKSNREVSIVQLVNEADAAEAEKGKAKLANKADFVEIDGKKMTVEELVSSYSKLKNAMEEKKENEDDEDDDEIENEDDDEIENEDDEDEDVENEDAEDTKKKNKKKKNRKKNAKDSVEKRRAKEKAERLRNAHKNNREDDYGIGSYDPMAGVERGKARYGS